MWHSNKGKLAVTVAQAVAAIALSDAAFSQEASNTKGDASGEQNIEVITVYGRQENMTVKDVPQTVSIFDQESFEIGLFDTVGDALRLVPNAARSGSSLDMFADDYLFRGFAAEQSINGLGFIQTDHPTDLANVERIEILKGPASVLYGQMEPGGTINVVTEQPLAEAWGEVGLEYGSYGRKRATLDVTGPLTNAVRARLNLAYQESDSHIDFLEQQRVFVAPNVTMDLSDKTVLTVEGSYSANEWAALNPGTPVEGAILNNPNGDYSESFNVAWEDGYTERDSQYTNVRLVHALTDKINARASYTHVRNDADFAEYVSTGLEDDMRTLGRGVFVGRDTYKKDHNVILDVSGEVETGALIHKFAAGIDYRTSDASRPTQIYFIDPIDLYNPQYAPLNLSELDPVRDRTTNQDDDVAAFFLQDRIALGERLHLLTGLRYIESSQAQETIENADGSSLEEAIDQEDWTTQLGFVYEFSEEASVYASRSESFVPQQGTTSGLRPLEAEESVQYEAGARFNFAGLQANFAIFEITKDNIAIEPPELDFVVAEGESQSRGAEFSIGGYINPNWFFAAAYGYTDTEILRSDDVELEGNRFGNIPYDTASMQTRYYFTGIPGFSLGSTVSYTGERFGDEYNEFELPGHTRVDLAAFYAVTSDLRVDFLVSNVLDEEVFSPGPFSGVVREPERAYLARLNYIFW